MLKQCLLALVAAGLISVAAPFAAAQDSPSKDQQSPPYPARRTAELTKQLKLTPDQQTKVQYALQSEHSQMENLRQDISVSQQDRHAKMMEIHKSTNAEIRALLDSNQQQKWDDMQAKRRQWMQKHPE
jgi:Spy/CpxP family protein refolding chaperone